MSDLHELSKKTLVSYYDKSIKDARGQSKAIRRLNLKKSDKNPQKNDLIDKERAAHLKKFYQRMKGTGISMKKIVKKISKEIEGPPSMAIKRISKELGMPINESHDKLNKEDLEMTGELIEAIIDKKAIDAESAFNTIMAEKISDAIEDIYFGEEEDLTDEDFEEILDDMSEEDFASFIEEIELTEEDLDNVENIMTDVLMEMDGEELDEEDLQELSRKTLSSYISKAKQNMSYHDRKTHDTAGSGGVGGEFDYHASQFNRRRDHVLRAKDKLGKERYIGSLPKTEYKTSNDKKLDFKTITDKQARRRRNHKLRNNKVTKNISNRVRILAKEDTDLQELSRKTLASYVRRAAIRGIDATMKFHNHSDEDAHKASRFINKRIKGIGSATKRLAKEDLELEDMIQEAIMFVLETVDEEIDEDTLFEMVDEVLGFQIALFEELENISEEDFEDLTEEDLTELSRATLARYTAAAGMDKGKRDSDNQTLITMRNKTGQLKHDIQRMGGDYRKASDAEDISDKAIKDAINKNSHKSNKRSFGMFRAIRKLSEEDLTELSKKLLGRYVSAAIDNKADHERNSKFLGKAVDNLQHSTWHSKTHKRDGTIGLVDKVHKISSKAATKRNKGIHRALSKMTDGQKFPFHKSVKINAT